MVLCLQRSNHHVNAPSTFDMTKLTFQFMSTLPQLRKPMKIISSSVCETHGGGDSIWLDRGSIDTNKSYSTLVPTNPSFKQYKVSVLFILEGNGALYGLRFCEDIWVQWWIETIVKSPANQNLYECQVGYITTTIKLDRLLRSSDCTLIPKFLSYHKLYISLWSQLPDEMGHKKYAEIYRSIWLSTIQ